MRDCQVHVLLMLTKGSPWTSLQHALGSAVQVSCPRFGGPHLGQPADASAVAEVPSTEDERSQADDDDEDGAFGDFWRASR